MKVVSSELDLHSLTVEEALPALDRYLSDAFLEGHREVRIVHGKGSGILRQAVTRELKKHPLVRSFRIGGHREGQTGVTIVKLIES
jgi:DNA mismatch repair protein MutS2